MSVNVDMNHGFTLGSTIEDAFVRVAEEHGVRLEGIEDDVNETMLFWLKVAQRIQQQYDFEQTTPRATPPPAPEGSP